MIQFSNYKDSMNLSTHAVFYFGLQDGKFCKVGNNMKIREIKKTMQLGDNPYRPDIPKKKETTYKENYMFDSIFQEELDKLNKQDRKDNTN